MGKPLHIISASAGSGKTFYLVKEYLKLLLSGTDNEAFRSILAMTFTNKAAFEMKERILLALDEICLSKPNNAVLEKLLEEGNKKEHELLEASKAAIQGILHNYEDFHVMTMDKFNLRLIKAFSRDLDLPGDFEVVFDEEELLENIVDQLMDRLGNPEFKDVNELILKFARARLGEDQSWNIRRQLIDFGKILSKERNRKSVDKLNEIDFSLERYNVLQGERKSIEKPVFELFECLLKILPNVDPASLPGGQTTYKTLMNTASLRKLPIDKGLLTESMQGKINGEEKKKFEGELLELLTELNNYLNSKMHQYILLRHFLSNYFNMALLKDIATSLVEARSTDRLIRISEFNELLSRLIQDEEAPFIYERLGTKFKHYLLDEFQDTSHLQWMNLVPLVYNSLAEGHLNLIVGDPKQSIYRFKNGVAEQFVSLPSIYNPEHDSKIQASSQFFETMGKVDQLGDNWRSSPVIVEFNNAFFTHLRSKLSKKGQEFYRSIDQQAKKETAGYVEIESAKTKLSNSELVDKIEHRIKACLTDGFRHSDICILGITNKDCNRWAIELNDRGYKVVSTDSLLIKNDPWVNLCIAYFQLRVAPSGRTEQKRFADLYIQATKREFSEYTSFFTQINGKSYFDFVWFTKCYFDNREELFCAYESLYDLIQRFLKKLDVSEVNEPYLHHLADVIFDFEHRKGVDIKRFLDYYEQHKSEFAVQIPESSDALTVMTIHKSKGLEFPVVILPKIDLGLRIKDNFLVHTSSFPLYKIPAQGDLLPELQAIYAEEMDQILIDAVNTAYVGMTRPKFRMYVMNYYDGNYFGAFYHKVLEEFPGAELNDELLSVRCGKEVNYHPKAATEITAFTPTAIGKTLWFPEIAILDKDQLENSLLEEDRQFGIQFHYVMSQLRSLDNLEKILEEGMDEGKIERKHLERIHNLSIAALQLESYQVLLEGAETIINEQLIISDSGSMLRPDKIIMKHNQTIVVDFKTGVQHSKHKAQIQTYVNELGSLGLPTVSGYLYYTDSLKLVAV